MKKGNAQILLELRATETRLFRFKSSLSRLILLHVAMNGEDCELRQLMKAVDVTAVAARQHIQLLEHEGFLAVSAHKTNRRCKIVSLTKKSKDLLHDYEQEILATINRWEASA